MVRHLFSRFLCHETGFILSSESVLMGSVSVLGLLVGLVSVRDALVLEMQDFAHGIGFLNQSYSYTGVADGDNATEGGLFGDTLDLGDFDGSDEIILVGEDPEQ